MSVQYIIVYIILAITAAYIIKRAAKHFSKKKASANCSGCPLAHKCNMTCGGDAETCKERGKGSKPQASSSASMARKARSSTSGMPSD